MLNTVWSYWDWFAHTFIKPYHDEITAIFTLVIGVFTVALASIARRQTKDTRILQRAYVSVNPAGIYMFRNRNEAVAQVEIVNAGNLPATKLKWFVRTNLIEGNGADEWEISIDHRHVPDGSHVVAPHAKIRQGSRPPIPVGQHGLRHQEGLYLYVWGAITYDNGFRRRRMTTFCHRYNCVNFTLNPQWGFVAMSAVHARDHRHGNSAN